jgi:hypothetical protein
MRLMEAVILFLKITALICGVGLLMAFAAELSFHIAALRMVGLGIMMSRPKWVFVLFLFGNMAIALGCWTGQRLHVFPFFR